MRRIYKKTGEFREYFKDGFEPDVVITAGGTSEDIDDVRYITNSSTGELGAKLADAYYDKGYKVLLLATQEATKELRLSRKHEQYKYKALCYTKQELPDDEVDYLEDWSKMYRPHFPYMIDDPDSLPHLEVRPFRSAADLRRELLAIPSARLVLHAAAVADYSPVKEDGKISSDQEELTIRLKRNPKILAELRDHFGRETTIVGFKLLSGASEADLIYAAVKQMNDNETNYCIANDLQEKSVPTTRVRTSTQLRGRGQDIIRVLPPDPNVKERKLHIVGPNYGVYETVQDSTAKVAAFIADKILPSDIKS